MIDPTKNPNKIVKDPRESLFAEKPKGRVGKFLGATAIVSGLGLASFIGNQGGEAPTPLSTTETTMVIAEEGDSLLGLQQREGLNGMPTDEARQKLTELNGGNQVYPGQEVAIMDNVDNNPPGEE